MITTVFVLLLCALTLVSSSTLSPKDDGSRHSGWDQKQEGCLWKTNSTIGMPVNTTSGRIIGHADPTYPYVSEYLSIPFAKPPIDALRFAPPQPYSGASDIVADQQPPSCIQGPAGAVNKTWAIDFQNLKAAGASITRQMGEDCLYLNIWTKFPSPDAPLKPVLIWIYGGGYHSGGIRDDSEQGAIFAEEDDVVFVSINYRLSYFGFPGAPGTTQNVALLDQRLAIEWVRDNIAGFGGDPNRMIIFGHSAGGSSVDLYSYAWADDPIVYGSIPMSGNALSFGSRYPETTAKGWYAVSESVGCGNSSTASDDAILACVRSKNATELFEASEAANKEVIGSLSGAAQAYAGVTGIFGPTIDNITVFQNYTNRGEAGQFAKVPMMTGSNSDEGCFFAMQGQIPVSDEEELTTVVFTCPTYYTALYRAEAGLPTWKYRYVGAYPNVYANACPGRPWHGQEVYVAFNSTGLSKEAVTPEEAEMGWTWRDALSTFAHDPGQGLAERQGWPTLSVHDSSIILLGRNETDQLVENAAVWNRPCLDQFVSGATNF